MKTTIGTIFDVNYGQKKFHNKEPLEGKEGKNILISSKGDDNGLYGFFKIENNYKAPFITIPSTGSIGEAFVQEYDCSVDDNCLVLIPKEKKSIPELLQIAYQIRRNKWRYKYGRQITPKRIKEQIIFIEAINLNYEKYVNDLLPGKVVMLNIRENKNIEMIKLTELCEIKRKNAPPKNNMKEGKTPYIATTSKNNGVTEFVNAKPNSKGKCLSVALNGSCGQTFFQFDDFITSGDNAILNLKGTYNPYILFYIGYQIYRQRWGFNYYRKLSENRLRKMLIPIPYKNGKIDIDYIKEIIENTYGFEELRKYI